MVVKVAGSSLSFSKQPLDVALRELANLGFSFVDICLLYTSDAADE